MIFVSAGTPDKPFNRLIEGVDRIADGIGEPVLAQIGHSTYLPRHMGYFAFCDRSEMLSHIKKASIIISQAGFGIIGDAIRCNKPMILVPREFTYGEAVDKQYELAEYLASQHESVICVRDIDRLAQAVKDIRNVSVDYDYRAFIPELINSYIKETFLL